MIKIDILERTLDIVGIKGELKSPEEIETILAERKAKWRPRKQKYSKGVLGLFSKLASSPMKGAYLDFDSTRK